MNLTPGVLARFDRIDGFRIALGVDADDDRHAGAQQIFTRNRHRHTDAHRQTLDDLGEVAGGIVRRQQREDRSRSRREAVDDSWNRAAADRIDGLI